MIATGVFAEKVGLIHGDPTVFLHYLAALIFVSIFAFGGSYLLFKVSNRIIPLRVAPEYEEISLDLSQHDERVEVFA